MSANPPRGDRWRPYDDVRFVLIRNIGRLKPSRGLVLDWRKGPRKERRSQRWEALVIYLDEAALQPVIKTEWLPAERLVPVDIDPNHGATPGRRG